MADLNKVLLIGHVENPAVVARNSSNGRFEITFDLLTANFYVDKNSGEKKSAKVRHPIVYISKSDGLAKYLTKGKYVFLEGFIRRDEQRGLMIATYNVQLLGDPVRGPVSKSGYTPANNEIPDEDIPY